MTPTQFYLGVRLEKANQMLRHSTLAVRNVALACGFASIPYFCRAYKARYRTSPGSKRTLDDDLVGKRTVTAIPGKESADLGNDL